jgi:hypothetical protein
MRTNIEYSAPAIKMGRECAAEMFLRNNIEPRGTKVNPGGISYETRDGRVGRFVWAFVSLAFVLFCFEY